MSQRWKLFYRSTACMLAAVMTFQTVSTRVLAAGPVSPTWEKVEESNAEPVIPLYSLGEGDEAEEQMESGSFMDAEEDLQDFGISLYSGEEEVETQDDAVAVMELKEQREESLKCFKMSDGSTLAAWYPEPVHYKKNGQFKEIDNRLELYTAENGEQRYRNVANSFSASFALLGNSGRLLEFEGEDCKIIWNAEGNRENAGQIIGTATVDQGFVEVGTGGDSAADEEISGKDVISTELMESGILSYSALGNISYQYEMMWDGVKENIILTGPQKVYDVTVQVGLRIHCAGRTKVMQVCKKPIVVDDFNGFLQ